MAQSGEFYSFDEVLRKLSIDRQRLMKLVSEGEIRAFREGEAMKFRRGDIDGMGRTRPVSGGEDATAAIDLSAGGGRASETLTDDLIFDEGDDLSNQEAGMATAEISSQDTFIDEGQPAGMTTEPLDVDGEPKTMETSPAGRRKPAAGATMARPAAAPRRAVEEPTVHVAWTLLLVVSSVLMVAGCMVAWDIGRMDREGNKPGALSQWVGENLGGQQASGSAK